jgi:FtsP/CotA-like multicopper oxidase with cupredoxin domain
MTSGLYGPIIVLPPGESFHPEVDKVFLISRFGKRRDGQLLLNGEPQPTVQHWQAGRQYRLRFININANNIVTVSLKQDGQLLSWTSIAKDGADLPPEQALAASASFLIAPGETYDFQFRAEEQADIELSLDLALFKERVVQAIRVDGDTPH